MMKPEPDEVTCWVLVHGQSGIHWMDTTSKRQTVRQKDGEDSTATLGAIPPPGVAVLPMAAMEPAGP